MLIGAIIFFLLTPLFNISNITVSGNSRLSSEQIINSSGIEEGKNTFKLNKKEVIDNIKKDSYVDSVKITRKLPSTVNIQIVERQAAFSIQYIGGYIYIDNQGYLLEISKDTIVYPIIINAKTPEDKLEIGTRLVNEDLDSLQTVLKIAETLKSNNFYSELTTIDVANKDNYVLYLNSEDKYIEIGNGSDISNKMPYIKRILSEEQGKKGRIIINEDINKVNPYFREEV